MAVAAIRAAQRKRRQREAADARRAAEEGRSEAPPKAPEAPAKPVEDASPPTGVWKYQPLVRAVYTNARTQLFVAALIVLNFLCNVLEKQAVRTPETWRALEHTFNAIFLVELLVNMYSHWFWRFWSSSWNVFDFIVVAVGCISFFTELDGPLKLLRCLRAFRVFRLFKRIKSLNKIIVMIVSAVPGVASAFAVMLITICIYALMAVEFFSLFGGTSGLEPHAPMPLACVYTNVLNDTVEAVSSRSLCYGEEYWGTFLRAWYTLFQMLTGESWSEAIARPVIFGWSEEVEGGYGSASNVLAALFFISFILVNTFILFNVFVAVLLDKAPLPPPLAPPPPASVAIAAIASSLSIFSAAPSGRHTPGADTNGAPTPRR